MHALQMTVHVPHSPYAAAHWRTSAAIVSDATAAATGAILAIVMTPR